MTPGELPNNAATPGQRYAIETRAEILNVRSGGDAIRRGDINEVRTGQVERFEDAVYGEEKATIKDTLVETAERGSTFAAETLEFTVNGRLSVSAVGWPENKFSGEDAIILGGAMAETWTGGALIAAAMSDDLIVGGGVRLTAPLDVWVNQLTGLQERPGTAQADAVFREFYGTLFEREYGAGTHVAGVANFSGSVYQTQRTGFRPLMRTALGVRNLIPVAAPGVAPEPSPPAPPPGPAGGTSGAGAGTMVATNAGAGAAGSARSADNFQDMGRVANAAEDMENAAALHRAEGTADTLDDLAATARLGDPDAPQGTVNQASVANVSEPLDVDGPYGHLGDVDDPYGPIDDIDDPLSELMDSPVEAGVEHGRLELPQTPDVAQPMSDAQIDLSARLEDLNGGFDTEFNHDTSRLLDLEMDDAVEGSVVDGFRVDDSTGINTSAAEPPGARAPSAQPSLDDSGAGWSTVGENGPTSPDAAAEAPAPAQGNYQTMPSGESGVSPDGGVSPSDLDATLDTSANRHVPDDFDCVQIHADLDRVYYEHRDNSNWHGLEAYGVVNDLREDLRIMVSNVGGNIGDGDIQRLYAEIHRIRTTSMQEGNVAQMQRIDGFLDWYHLKVFDTSEDLVQRADEFNDALTGGMHLLDPDVDRAKLQQWLLEQRDTALVRLDHMADMNDSQIQTTGREFPYYHQLWLALEEGRDPLVESLHEIEYLQSVNKTGQVEEYLEYHRKVLALLSDPEFRVTTPEVVEPGNMLRPGLESTDAAAPSLAENLQTTVLNAELNEPNIATSMGGTGEVAGVDFDANRRILDGLVGADDLAQPPANQPHWMASVPLRRILFPTGDPGFEHLIEGSLAGGSIADIVESTQTVAEAEDGPQLPNNQHPETIGTGTWEPRIRAGAGPRFGAPPPSPGRLRGAPGLTPAR